MKSTILLVFLSLALYGQTCGTMNEYLRIPLPVYTDADFTEPECECLRVGVSLFVNQDMVDLFGADQAVAIAETNFANASIPYDSIGIERYIAEIEFIDVSGNTTQDLWINFSGYPNNPREILGDVGMLYSYYTPGGPSGGIALVDALGTQYPFGVSVINSNPDWGRKVDAHEAGHVIGSQHTHDCVWGPNQDEAQDNCAGPNLVCETPSNNVGGIMSYCHLGGGVDIAWFGVEQTLLLRNKVATKLGCQCDDPPPPPPSDDCENEVVIEILLDDHPSEITWSIGDYSGGPYTRDDTLIRDTLCFEDGCHDFTIYDSYGDGLSGSCFNGYWSVNGIEGEAFTNSSVAVICFNDDPEPPAQCEYLDQTPDHIDNDRPIYGASDKTVINGHNWIAIQGPFTITESTVLYADYKSPIESNYSGIAFTNSLDLEDGFFLQMFGTDVVGHQWLNYYDSDYNYLFYNDPIGEYLLTTGELGTYQYMLLVNVVTDHPLNAQSVFKRIKLCDEDDAVEALINPSGDGQLYNLLGQPVNGNLPPGMYIRNGKKVILP